MDTGLFDKIICAIAKEQELQASKKLLFAFLSLLIVSVVSMPFTVRYLADQWIQSGTSYFVGAPFLNFNMFLQFWDAFLLSIIESFPILAVILFAINISLLLFTVRLFLHKKGALLKYLKYEYPRNS